LSVFLGYLLPQLFKGIGLALINIFGFVSFEAADNPIADSQDFGNEIIMRKPAIE